MSCMTRLATIAKLATGAACALLVASLLASPANAIGTSFSYQGQLKKNGAPYNGTANFAMRLYNVPTGGSILASQNIASVPVSNGLFTTKIDFGVAFDGSSRWLEIWADTAGEGYVVLTPRQEIQSVPYAQRSSVAESGVIGGQWQSGATGIYYLGGNVAIGQSSDANADRRFIVNTSTANANAGWFKSNNVSYATLVVQNDAINGIGLYDEWSDKHYLAGRVGVGTITTTDAQLTVVPGNTAVGIKASGFGTFSTGAAVWGVGTGGQVFGDCAGILGESSYGNGVEGIASEASFYGGYFDNTAGGTALYADGLAKVRSLQIIGGADLVEGFDTKGDAAREPGTVVVIDEQNAGGLRASDAPYDRKVAGVVSGAGGVEAGIRLGQEGKLDGETLVAMTGRVYVKCSSENGAIRPGDLLTTSSISGHAMRATDHDLANGAVIGKAMSSLDARTGLVLVLVNLQ